VPGWADSTKIPYQLSYTLKAQNVREKEKVIFTSLDYGSSPYFLLGPQNRPFGLLELAIPDILSP